MNEPVVVLIQFCRVKLGLRDGDVKICSSYDVTQSLFNLDQPEFKSFTERDREYQTPIRSITSMSSLSYTNTIDESTSQSMDLITISDIFDTENFGEFWIAARINGIESPTDWFYTSCPKKGCNKKLELSEGVNKCFKCVQVHNTHVLRYKLRVRVVDMKGNASFLIWDRECMELIGIAAIWDRECMELIGIAAADLYDSYTDVGIAAADLYDSYTDVSPKFLTTVSRVLHL
ncbi:uncharacterized protein LOC116023556 [Ipomoea triloba]|uniref:uncharacterized protein LOC116023556 n=1 Tax=Ipomoea triloba TaxID=35885 RepID=UPI00125D530E|nr:uncharacterized protein LOC116023556 [Ipomoea triloba]